MVAHVTTNRRGRLVASHTLVVCGGITEYYLRDQLWYWTQDLARIRAEVSKQTAGRRVDAALSGRYLELMTSVPANLSCQPCFRASKPTQMKPSKNTMVER